MKDKIVVFTLDDLSFAFPLSTVVKVIHAIEIRHLPKAPPVISGIINVKGQIIPVADMRFRLGLEARKTEPDDRIIIADTGKREVAILVDTVTGIEDLTPRELSSASDSLPFAEHLKGVAKLEEDLVLIYDLDQFLSLDEEKELERALKTKKK